MTVEFSKKGIQKGYGKIREMMEAEREIWSGEPLLHRGTHKEGIATDISLWEIPMARQSKNEMHLGDYVLQNGLQMKRFQRYIDR